MKLETNNTIYVSLIYKTDSRGWEFKWTKQEKGIH
jgi:hypothetical protein